MRCVPVQAGKPSTLPNSLGKQTSQSIAFVPSNPQAHEAPINPLSHALANPKPTAQPNPVARQAPSPVPANNPVADAHRAMPRPAARQPPPPYPAPSPPPTSNPAPAPPPASNPAPSPPPASRATHRHPVVRRSGPLPSRLKKSSLLSRQRAAPTPTAVAVATQPTPPPGAGAAVVPYPAFRAPPPSRIVAPVMSSAPARASNSTGARHRAAQIPKQIAHTKQTDSASHNPGATRRDVHPPSQTAHMTQSVTRSPLASVPRALQAEPQKQSLLTRANPRNVNAQLQLPEAQFVDRVSHSESAAAVNHHHTVPSVAHALQASPMPEESASSVLPHVLHGHGQVQATESAVASAGNQSQPQRPARSPVPRALQAEQSPAPKSQLASATLSTQSARPPPNSATPLARYRLVDISSLPLSLQGVPLRTVHVASAPPPLEHDDPTQMTDGGHARAAPDPEPEARHENPVSTEVRPSPPKRARVGDYEHDSSLRGCHRFTPSYREIPSAVPTAHASNSSGPPEPVRSAKKRLSEAYLRSRMPDSAVEETDRTPAPAPHASRSALASHTSRPAPAPHTSDTASFLQSSHRANTPPGHFASPQSSQHHVATAPTASELEAQGYIPVPNSAAIFDVKTRALGQMPAASVEDTLQATHQNDAFESVGGHRDNGQHVNGQHVDERYFENVRSDGDHFIKVFVCTECVVIFYQGKPWRACTCLSTVVS